MAAQVAASEQSGGGAPGSLVAPTPGPPTPACSQAPCAFSISTSVTLAGQTQTASSGNVVASNDQQNPGVGEQRVAATLTATASNAAGAVISTATRRIVLRVFGVPPYVALSSVDEPTADDSNVEDFAGTCDGSASCGGIDNRIHALLRCSDPANPSACNGLPDQPADSFSSNSWQNADAVPGLVALRCTSREPRIDVDRDALAVSICSEHSPEHMRCRLVPAPFLVRRWSCRRWSMRRASSGRRAATEQRLHSCRTRASFDVAIYAGRPDSGGSLNASNPVRTSRIAGDADQLARGRLGCRLEPRALSPSSSQRPGPFHMRSGRRAKGALRKNRAARRRSIFAIGPSPQPAIHEAGTTGAAWFQLACSDAPLVPQP